MYQKFRNLTDNFTKKQLTFMSSIIGVLFIILLFFGGKAAYTHLNDTYARIERSKTLSNGVSAKDDFNKLYKESLRETSETHTGREIVFIMYKTDCGVCKQNQNKIVQMSKKIYNADKEKDTKRVNVHFINVDKGMPDWLSQYVQFPTNSVKKTPYAFTVRSDFYTGTTLSKRRTLRYVPLVYGRLLTDETMTTFRLGTLRSRTIWGNQIRSLINVNQTTLTE